MNRRRPRVTARGLSLLALVATGLVMNAASPSAGEGAALAVRAGGAPTSPGAVALHEGASDKPLVPAPSWRSVRLPRDRRQSPYT